MFLYVMCGFEIRYGQREMVEGQRKCRSWWMLWKWCPRLLTNSNTNPMPYRLLVRARVYLCHYVCHYVCVYVCVCMCMCTFVCVCFTCYVSVNNFIHDSSNVRGTSSHGLHSYAEYAAHDSPKCLPYKHTIKQMELPKEVWNSQKSAHYQIHW